MIWKINSIIIPQHFNYEKQNGPKVVDRLLKNEDLSHIPAAKWGINKEDAARQAQIKEMVSSQSESIL